jgi:bifunctional DNase/RNase
MSHMAARDTKETMDSALVKLTVQGVWSDASPNAESQVVLLQDEAKTSVLPIWVGTAEGTAIRMALEGIAAPRPLSHDLLRSITEHLSLKVGKVVVTDVKNNTYYALIYLGGKQPEVTVDSRPSDAIALALRTNSPIYATRDVLDRQSPETVDPWLKNLDTKGSGGAA